MEYWLIGIIGILAIVAAILLGRLLSLRHSIVEVADGLDEKMSTDTNTLISISSGDKTIRALTAQINTQLNALRQERLRLQNGDTELKTAITNISHDLRTPLTAICGYLDLLEEENKNSSGATGRYLDVIRERTDTMRSLTEELFQYSIITSTADELTVKPVSLNDILEQSIAGFYGVLSERSITPVIRMPEQPVMRMLDAFALERVFDNILSNVAKYSDGDLSITLTSDGSITFSNTAKQLDRVQAERLFDRFYTVEAARDSTGLGLSIAKLLTEKMGGQITAEYNSGVLNICVCYLSPQSDIDRQDSETLKRQ